QADDDPHSQSSNIKDQKDMIALRLPCFCASGALPLRIGLDLRQKLAHRIDAAAPSKIQVHIVYGTMLGHRGNDGPGEIVQPLTVLRSEVVEEGPMGGIEHVMKFLHSPRERPRSLFER